MKSDSSLWCKSQNGENMLYRKANKFWPSSCAVACHCLHRNHQFIVYFGNSLHDKYFISTTDKTMHWNVFGFVVWFTFCFWFQHIIWILINIGRYHHRMQAIAANAITFICEFGILSAQTKAQKALSNGRKLEMNHNFTRMYSALFKSSHWELSFSYISELSQFNRETVWNPTLIQRYTLNYS